MAEDKEKEYVYIPVTLKDINEAIDYITGILADAEVQDSPRICIGLMGLAIGTMKKYGTPDEAIHTLFDAMLRDIKFVETSVH